MQTVERELPLTQTPAPRKKKGTKHTRGIVMVGLFKLGKAIFFGAVGAGALDLIHKNVGNLLMNVIATLRIDPAGHLVSRLMDKADLIGGHQLRQVSMATFGYAGLCLVEGCGLLMEKGWAEYLTVILTTLGLPWELYELGEKFSLYKVGLILLNLLVLAYLVWILRKKRKARSAEAAEGAA